MNWTNFKLWAAIIITIIAAGVVIMLLIDYYGTSTLLLGPGCSGMSNFNCGNPSFNANGTYDTLSLQFGQVSVSTLYNLQLACVSGYSNATGRLVPVPASAWQTISDTGTAFESGGLSNSGLNLAPEDSEYITGLKCYNATGVALYNEPYNSIFSGYILANFSTGACPGGQSCVWNQVKAATVALKVH